MAERYEFGGFMLERSQQRVRRADGSTLALTPRMFATLLLFVEQADRLLDRDTMMRALWPGLVVEENNLSQVVAALRRALGDDGPQRRFIETVARRGFRFVAPVTEVSGPFAASVNAVTLAVLPFVPLMQQGRDESLELGMADSLITRLSQVPGLVVRSVGSLRRFVGPDQDPLAAARALDVAWIVDGSLQRSGERLRVTARLLCAADGTARWSSPFDERFVGVFEMQDLISARVADVLAPMLAGLHDTQASPRTALAEIGGTRGPDAYQLYLAARQHAQGVRGDGLARSLELFEQALRIDPNYALACAGQAETFRRMVFGADQAPADVFPRYRQVVLRALALAPNLAEAHAQLGWIHFWHDFDWPQAERVFRHAIALNPNVVGARFGLGFLLLTLDRCDEGIDQVRLARELDPLSLIVNTMEASFLFGMGRRVEASARLERALQIDPDFWVAHMTRATFHLADGALEAAIDALASADERAYQSTQAAALLGATLARAGRSDEARAVLARLQALSLTRYVPPTSLAALCAALGEPDAALTLLERAFEQRDVRLAYMKDDPRWAELRGQARFRTLLRRMKLDRYGPGVSGP
jgi:DNA-binding winged helix-turn-helix (wHTH) protein/tetratricopeptide (TPR) repeat protein